MATAMRTSTPALLLGAAPQGSAPPPPASTSEHLCRGSASQARCPYRARERRRPPPPIGDGRDRLEPTPCADRPAAVRTRLQNARGARRRRWARSPRLREPLPAYLPIPPEP